MYQHENKIKDASNLLNNYFDRIFVVTIERATERHKFLKKSLKGLNYELVYGFDKDNFTEAFLNENYDEKFVRKKTKRNRLTDSEIAISSSHKAVYKKIIDENINNSLVLEDDAFFLQENLQFLPNFFDDLPTDWELVYLGYNQDKEVGNWEKVKMYTYLFLKKFGFYYYWTNNQIKNRFSEQISTNLKVAGYHDGAHAYAITNGMAKKLLEYQTPVKYPADNLLSTFCTNRWVKAYISFPRILTQVGLDKELIKKIKSMNV